MYRKEDISEAEYDSEMAELKAELIKMEGRLKPKKERNIGIYKELKDSKWRKMYESLNEEKKRAFFRKYIKEIIVNSDGELDGVKFF